MEQQAEKKLRTVMGKVVSNKMDKTVTVLLNVGSNIRYMANM